MAGWSLFSGGAEIFQSLRRNGVSPDSDGVRKFRSVFDLVYSHFSEENSPEKGIFPLTVMMGDGKPVDLFNLYWCVKERGGYNPVSESRSWGKVAEEAGLASNVAAPLKLIYGKYLEPFDRWLWRIAQSKGIRRLWKIIEEKGRAGGLDVEITYLLRAGMDVKNGRECLVSEVIRAETPSLGGNGSVVNDGNDDVVILEPHHANEISSPQKRKRERDEEEEEASMFNILKWAKRIAKDPCDPTVGMALEGSTKNELEVEYQKRVLIIRKALLLRRPPSSSILSPHLQRRQKMHPSMYEDPTSSENQFKNRCSQRLLSQQLGPCSSSFSATSSAPNESEKNQSPIMSWMEDELDSEVLKTLGSFTAETLVRLFGKEQMQNRVPLGPQYQAKLPEWTGLACNSDDSKWLGTQIWPLKPDEQSSVTEHHPIGKGRSDSCSCSNRGSFECVRFHVAEKRIQLKWELGSAFYKWRFNRMGEEISLSWTDEEERRFKAIVHQNPPSQEKCFWEEIYKSFHHSKSNQSLLNYYFDVFLLRRRSYQNHVTPNHIDSDDEESDFGSASSEFGCDNLRVQGFSSAICSQNKHCIVLDGSLDAV